MDNMSLKLDIEQSEITKVDIEQSEITKFDKRFKGRNLIIMTHHKLVGYFTLVHFP